MTPEDKCKHGVYKAGYEIAHNCGICNPIRNDITLRGLPKFKPSQQGAVSERTVSVSRFISQPIGARLATLEEAA